LDPIGLLARVFEATSNIHAGRKGFATRGKEREGRISYETGIAEALSVFAEAQATGDPQTIILAEYTFIAQELEFCDEGDVDVFGSLVKATRSFDDAFVCLKTVSDTVGYKVAERTYLNDPKYRVRGLPKDAFHVTCLAHGTRIQNILRTPGVDAIEKSLLKQRFANLSAARNGYLKKQKKVLEAGDVNDGGVTQAEVTEDGAR
jgi:hypothetical protein